MEKKAHLSIVLYFSTLFLAYYSVLSIYLFIYL